MLEMPELETQRLRIRPFTRQDLPAAHQLFDVELSDAELDSEPVNTLAEREAWLEWTVRSYAQLAKMHQPPYGDRAIVLKSSAQLIGACGFVPCLLPFEQMPHFTGDAAPGGPARATTEFGLFYAISPAHRRRGYAVEAVQALLAYAFEQLNLKRVVATTTYDNQGSIGVMRKLGMRIVRNPLPEPPWLQVVGVSAHPKEA